MNRPRLVAAVVAFLGMSVVTACSADTTDGTGGGGSGGQVTLAAVQAWAGFNPYVPDQGTSIGINIANAIYPSTFHVEADQTVVLNDDLLESAEIVSTDPQVVEYRIQDDAVWSDGTAISADDFVYLWKHLNGSDKDLQVTSAIGYKQIAAVSSDGDPKAVKVEFSSPFADWKSLFSPLLPAHHMASLGEDAAAWNTGLVEESPVSGGPYAIAENRTGEFLQLAPNPQWYGDAPTIDDVTLRFFGDDQSVLQALASGEVDFALDLKATRALISQADGMSGLVTKVVPTTNQQFLNTQFASPTVGDLAVRRAIATALVPEKIAETAFGGDVAELLTTHHILAPASPWYAENRPEGFGTGDVDAARQILTDAGYTPGADGVFAKDGTRLELNYLVRAEDDLARQVGVIAQDELKKIGIAIKLNTVNSADWFPTLGKADYDIGLGNYPASAFPVSWYGGLYPCDAGYNFARYCNKDFDAIYYSAYGELDDDKRADLVHQADDMLWEDVANIPLFEVPQLVVHASDLDGVDVYLPKEYQLLAASTWRRG
ncbi:ABC transporter family substrate-binding protein [Nocardioides sp. L-11A]|uniref:ABC transporter family substrate-binding protein n=1 Tax=Nocardioides sp. L-11A TaxID=3043848 RepID=UPI00249A2D0A|nr:ABC transporter family substrate-binding protein [Nocardioides sp. L-11A]